MTEVKDHAAWIRASGWMDGRDRETYRAISTIGEVADFHARVREYLTADSRMVRGRQVPVTRFCWEVFRQFTEREPQGPRGEHWSGNLASGDGVDTLAHAKSIALRELKRLRAEHIAAGGDVGYGDAPAGDQIRAYLESRTRKAA